MVLLAVRYQYDGKTIEINVFNVEWTTQKQITLSKRKDTVILSSLNQCIDTLILFP